MGRNIDQSNAPTIDLTPEARDFGIVMGDTRALMGIRLLNPTSTDTIPVYDANYASGWSGRILRSRGGSENVALQFENATFEYTSSGTTTFSNREVQVFIPWDNAMFATINPPPNRPVTFLYDIWQVTYPNSENSYITDDGDLLHFERTVNPGTLIDTITRLNDRQLLIPAESVGVDFGCLLYTSPSPRDS